MIDATSAYGFGPEVKEAPASESAPVEGLNLDFAIDHEVVLSHLAAQLAETYELTLDEDEVAHHSIEINSSMIKGSAAKGAPFMLSFSFPRTSKGVPVGKLMVYYYLDSTCKLVDGNRFRMAIPTTGERLGKDLSIRIKTTELSIYALQEYMDASSFQKLEHWVQTNPGSTGGFPLELTEGSKLFLELELCKGQKEGSYGTDPIRVAFYDLEGNLKAGEPWGTKKGVVRGSRKAAPAVESPQGDDDDDSPM